MVQLPALNTPQFEWVKTNLARHPQPVPPIYQPELAADAIVWAARHDVREVNVGAPTVLTRFGDKFIPGLLDRYLARSGYESQQTDRPIDADRRDNLWEPVPGDHGAHGVFDRVAHRNSWQWRLTRLIHLGRGTGNGSTRDVTPPEKANRRNEPSEH